MSGGLLLLAALSGATGGLAKDLKPARVTAGGREMAYVLYVPRGASRDEPLPLVLFLHGQAESGRDGERQLSQGLGPALVESPGDWPALVLFPQKPEPGSEWEEYEDHLLAAVDRVRREHAIDPERIALTGLSQGGHGAWVLGARHPDLWSAVAPICGYAATRVHRAARVAPRGVFAGAPVELASRLRETPVWAFHGADDEIVPPRETVALVEALRAAGGSPRLTLYPGVGHGSWIPAYREPGFAAWLLAPRRAAPASAPERP